VQHVPSGGAQIVTQADAVASILSLSFDDRATSVFHCLSLGNGFLQRMPDGSLFALDASRTVAMIDNVTGQVWLREVGPAFINYGSVAHYRWRTTPRCVLGYSPLILACDSMQAALAIVRMASAMATNSANPSVVLSAPGSLSDKAVQNLKASWREAHSGDQQGGTAILEEGLVAKVLEAPSATDSQLVEAQEWGASDVCRLFQVPPTLCGLQKDSNRATSAEESRQFVARCLRPWNARIGDRLGRLLLSDRERARGIAIEHDLTELALGQGLERAQYLRELTGAGILTSNESRNSIGYEDAPNGDELRFQVNQVAASRFDQIGGGGNATP
jgi:phage portal protein BeeE